MAIDLNKIKAKLDEMKSRGGPKIDYEKAYFKPKSEGEYTVRYVPAPGADEGAFFVTREVYAVPAVAKSGKKYARDVLAPFQFGERDLFKEALADLRKEEAEMKKAGASAQKIESVREIQKRYLSKKQIWCLVLDRKNPDALRWQKLSQESIQTFVASLGNKHALRCAATVAELPDSVFDVHAGFDFDISYGLDKTNRWVIPKAWSIDTDSRPLADTKAEIERLLSTITPIDKLLFSPRDEAHQEEMVDAILNDLVPQDEPAAVETTIATEEKVEVPASVAAGLRKIAGKGKRPTEVPQTDESVEETEMF